MSTSPLAPTHPVASTRLGAREIEPAGPAVQPPKSDLLTGLLHHTGFHVELGVRLQRCCARSSTAGLLLVAVDGFRGLEDHYGHHLHEKVLPPVARAIKDTIRSTDLATRCSHDRFAFLAVGPTDEELVTIGDRIRAAVHALQVRFNGDALQLTASIGAALALPRQVDAGLALRLRTAAEHALCEALAAGDRIHVCSLLGPDERRLLLRISERRFSRWLVSRCVLDAGTVSMALIRHEAGVPLHELAVQHGLLTFEQVNQIPRDQPPMLFAETAIRLGLIDEDRVAWLLAVEHEDPNVLAEVLVRMGLLERREAAQLLAEYMAAARR